LHDRLEVFDANDVLLLVVEHVKNALEVVDLLLRVLVEDVKLFSVDV